MPPEGSAHRVLGLAPGASREAVEAAYRRLIKQHHPDRPGGDAEKARALIQAYRQLTRTSAAPKLVVNAPRTMPRKPTRRNRGKWAVAAVTAGLLFLVPFGDLPTLAGPEPSTWAPRTPAPPAAPRVPFTLQPMVAADAAAVEAGVDEARRMADLPPAASLAYSRSCAEDLRRLPSEGLLDHCLAFDIAAAKGLRNGPAWLAHGVMAERHGRAARSLLGDAVLADARVRDVRRLVERRLTRKSG